MAAGSVASNYTAGFINKTAGGKVTPKINAGIRLLAGALLPSFLGETKKAGMVTDFANGMLAEAAVDLARQLKIPGINGTDIDGSIDGMGNYNVGGTEIERSINGVSN